MALPTATIRIVAEVADDASYTLGLSDDAEPDASSFALLFSIGQPDDDASGCSVTAEPGQRTAYEAIERCELRGTHLRIHFKPEAALVLALPGELMLEFAVSPDEIRVLESGLRRLGVN